MLINVIRYEHIKYHELPRKYENLKKGESIQRANIQKQKFKVQKLYHRINNIRTDYINKYIQSHFEWQEV